MIPVADAIDELKAAHDSHIKKLTELHDAALLDLTQKLQRSRLESETLSKQKDELEGEVEGMRTEVEMLRQSFDLVQERLRRVLVDQDDLVKMLKLVEQVTNPKPIQQSSNPMTRNSSLKDIEISLKQREQDSSTIAALQAIKYFKKLEASDPVHLSRLLEISFCPDRSFSLSTSLLTSISVHMASDPSTAKAFQEHPVYAALLDEIIKLKQESNEMCKLLLAKNKNKKELIVEISKWINDKKSKSKEDKSVLKWLIDGENAGKTTGEMSVQHVFSNFLSKFNI